MRISHEMFYEPMDVYVQMSLIRGSNEEACYGIHFRIAEISSKLVED